MHATMLIIALAATGNALATPEWHTDYGLAMGRGGEQRRPVAVFIGTGKAGWEAMGREGLSLEAKRLLRDKYVCVYVDASEPEGQRLADRFQADKLPTLVLSDASRAYQAVRATGPLGDAQLREKLGQTTGYPLRASYYEPAGRSTPVRVEYCTT